MGRTKRIEWVDIVKYICIIMVMLSHLETRTEIWSAFYSPFFLSAFFFTAGYVYKQKDGFVEFLYKKFRQLFVPWLIFSIFDLILSQVISFNEHESLLEELKWNFLQIRGKGDKIWFVAALFVAFIPFYFFIRCYETKSQKVNEGFCHKCVPAVILAWLLSFASILYTRLTPAGIFPWNTAALPWHIEYMFQAMFYMVLGYIFRHNIEAKFDKHNSPKVRMAALIVYLLLVFVPFFGKINMPMMADILYQYLTSFIGIVTLILIAKAVKTNKYVDYVGQNTLIYFALHGKVYSIIQTLLRKFAGGFYSAVLNSVALSSVFCVALSLILSVILIVPAYIINRWFPFIVGRESTRIEKRKNESPSY